MGPIMQLELGTRFIMDLSGKVSFCGLPAATITNNLISDGRIMGILFEHLMAHTFTNLKHVPGSLDHDLLLNKTRRLECKTGKRTFDTAMSYMKGANREKDHQKYL